MTRGERRVPQEKGDEATKADFLEATRDINLRFIELSRHYKSTIKNMEGFLKAKKATFKGPRTLSAALSDEARLENVRRTGKRIPDEPIRLELSELRPQPGTAEVLNSVEYYLDVFRELTREMNIARKKMDPKMMTEANIEFEAKLKALEKYLPQAEKINWQEQ